MFLFLIAIVLVLVIAYLYGSTPQAQVPKEMREEWKATLKSLTYNKDLSGVKYDEDKQIIVIQGVPVNYSDITSVDVEEHRKEITETTGKTKKKHGVGRALVGGAIAGPVGAVVGAGTAKNKINTKSTTRTEVTKKIVVGYNNQYVPILKCNYNDRLFFKLNKILENNKA